MSKKKIVITGTAGLLGPHVARHFAEHGYHVVGIDRAVPKESAAQENLIVDLTNAGEVYSALSGAMGVVHLAAIPRPGIYTSEVTFGNNILASYHILEAADNLGIKKAVIASSESALSIFPLMKNIRRLLRTPMVSERSRPKKWPKGSTDETICRLSHSVWATSSPNRCMKTSKTGFMIPIREF